VGPPGSPLLLQPPAIPFAKFSFGPSCPGLSPSAAFLATRSVTPPYRPLLIGPLSPRAKSFRLLPASLSRERFRRRADFFPFPVDLMPLESLTPAHGARHAPPASPSASTRCTTPSSPPLAYLSRCSADRVSPASKLCSLPSGYALPLRPCRVSAILLCTGTHSPVGARADFCAGSTLTSERKAPLEDSLASISSPRNEHCMASAPFSAVKTPR